MAVALVFGEISRGATVVVAPADICFAPPVLPQPASAARPSATAPSDHLARRRPLVSICS
ncbi:MAG TPA: hypothetical protein VGF63_07915 [Solirubrobacteraceae bacterium]